MFLELVNEYEGQDISCLADLLKEFIATESLLEQAEDQSNFIELRNKARGLVDKLRAPPWNLSIDLLTDICDEATSWIESIDLWSNYHE